MPEGHTIHRVARDHGRDFAGQRLVVQSPQGRFADGARVLSGQTLHRVEALGKHLCYHWADGKLLHIHLGLYGKFRHHRSPPPPPRGEVRLRVVGAARSFDLNGPNRCELITADAWQAMCDRLGVDPLRNDHQPDAAWQKLSRSRAPIGALLLNQSVIAGVGNIYRSEVLFLRGIHPERPGRSLDRDEFDQLWNELRRLLRIGVRYNRIIVADPHDVGKSPARMTRDERLLIYKRDRCSRCGGGIESWVLGARKVFACPACQPA